MNNYKDLFKEIQEVIYAWWCRNFKDDTSWFQKYYVKFFKREQTSYGVQYSIRYYIMFFAGTIGIVFLVAYLSQLKWIYIVILLAIAILMFPVLMVAFINQQNELKRFDQVSSYLTNVLPIFVQRTKILWTLKEMVPLLKFRIKDVVQDAVNYIENNTTDPNAEKTALDLLEIEFPNSRIKAVNRLMVSVERDGSMDFNETSSVMYEDIENWINRVMEYQKDLTKRRTELGILCLMSVGMNILFISMYQSNDFFKGFGSLPEYQILTTAFLASVMIVITITISKLHGSWMVDDDTKKRNLKVEEAYEKMINNYNFGLRKGDIIASILMLLTGIGAMIFLKNKVLAVISFAFFALFLTFRNANKKKCENLVRKHLEAEFPMWLRTISINLYSTTVTQAINRSKASCSYVLAKEIEKFQSENEENPLSIVPYMTFLQRFKVNSAVAAMKVLYSIQNLGTKDIKIQIQSLITRNQKLLQKSEEMRNKESISSIELLGFIPVILFSVQMLVSLFLLVLTVVGQMSAEIAW